MAFVPTALPPIIDNSAIFIALAEATGAIGELRGACRRLINSNILIAPLQRQEALTSSAMEGTYTTTDRLILADINIKKDTDDSTIEVRNYILALNEAFKMLEKYPLSHRVIKTAHMKLLEGLSTARGSKKRPGEYKFDQNFIGSPTRKIEDARFIPPPPKETIECMDDLEKYLNKDYTSQAESLIDIALVHYQLETIHPFSDGNGRLGRMLVTLMSVNTKLLDMPVLYISPAIEKDKDQYIDLMYAVSTQGDWISWFNFFFQKVTQSCKDTVQTIDNLILAQTILREKVSDSIRSSNAMNLVDILFEYPALTISKASSKLNITYNAAQNLIEKLVELDILVELENNYPKTYIAWGIINVAQPNAN